MNTKSMPDHGSPAACLANSRSFWLRRRAQRRSPEFVLDGEPVLFATSRLLMPLVAGSAITE
ncbi:hypothetical protein [Streptomyces zaehneri]|uniref:hypothetical protein n=1 Tax=Streptomyces zaehneri TaxID=3051180 RepID=UPI0028CFE261|nr:hypothetical protein [Streptomyces sp. DSM 40713]